MIKKDHAAHAAAMQVTNVERPLSYIVITAQAGEFFEADTKLVIQPLLFFRSGIHASLKAYSILTWLSCGFAIHHVYPLCLSLCAHLRGPEICTECSRINGSQYSGSVPGGAEPVNGVGWSGAGRS